MSFTVNLLMLIVMLLIIIPEGVLHGELGDVGKVDHHAQPVHLHHHLSAQSKDDTAMILYKVLISM